MADIFISYSKNYTRLTEELARNLEAEGYITWWDTSLLPGDEFPDEIKRQLDAAKAVIVIWTESSVNSQWVRAEATRAYAQNKLLALHEPGLDFQAIPLPFNTVHSELVTERAKVFAALERRSIVPSNAPGPELAKLSSSAPSIDKKEPTPQTTPLSAAAALAAPNIPACGFGPPSAGVKIDAPIGNVRGGWFLPGAGKTEWFKDAEFSPEMVVAPAGSFMMGSKDGEGQDNERQQHKVTIPQAFAAGKYPVTFEEWDAFVADGAGGILGFGKKDRHRPLDKWGRGRQPVNNVSWEDAKAYIKWLCESTGQTYRLLSEAEWEYCCRAGSAAAYSFGSVKGDLEGYAWYSANSGGRTHAVGQKAENNFGLRDTHGNVWEWCEDLWHNSYKDKPEDLKANGSAWTTGGSECHVLRGGSWDSSPGALRCACRLDDNFWVRDEFRGFRVARDIEASI